MSLLEKMFDRYLSSVQDVCGHNIGSHALRDAADEYDGLLRFRHAVKFTVFSRRLKQQDPVDQARTECGKVARLLLHFVVCMSQEK
jgi:hypothetical protein